jgi:hypothetical protein
MLTVGARARLTEAHKRHGFESDETIVNAISTTDPKINFDDRRVLYEMRMPQDAYEKLNEIATANNMTIDDALCAVIDDDLSTSSERAYRAYRDSIRDDSGPKTSHAEAATGRKSSSRSRGK